MAVDEPNPTRPWWRSKQAIAPAILLLALSYPASVGPLGYGVGRGWVPMGPANAYVVPLNLVEGLPPTQALKSHVRWWVDLGRRHAAG